MFKRLGQEKEKLKVALENDENLTMESNNQMITSLKQALNEVNCLFRGIFLSSIIIYSGKKYNFILYINYWIWKLCILNKKQLLLPCLILNLDYYLQSTALNEELTSKLARIQVEASIDAEKFKPRVSTLDRVSLFVYN